MILYVALFCLVGFYVFRRVRNPFARDITRDDRTCTYCGHRHPEGYLQSTYSHCDLCGWIEGSEDW